MKRFAMAAAALALSAGAVLAQAPGQPAQPADPEQAARKGTINQPMGTPKGAESAPSVQPADPEEAARKGTINQPNAAGGSGSR